MIKRIILYVMTRILSEYRRPICYQRLLGVRVGKRNRFTGAINFGSEPYLIELGDNVTVAQGTTFITHDGGAGIFREDYPGLNSFGKISIGNNVFIGSSVTIMPGVSVGDNVVIGACSVVTKSIGSNVVVAGVPARVIKSIDAYKTGLLKVGVIIDPKMDRRQQIIDHCNSMKENDTAE